MTDNVLLRFLSHGLIDVGGDDAKLEKLQATAADLAGRLKKNPAKTIAYSLIAFDPKAPIDDPVVLEVIEVLKGRWATYSNTFSGTPLTVVRAILLDALTSAAVTDENIGVAFVTSARNTLPFIATADEQSIWADAVAAIEERVDSRAEIEWATPATITVTPPTFTPLEIGAPSVKTGRASRDSLKKAILAAAGPQYYVPEQSNNVATNGNPQWPQNGNTQWVAEFGSRMSVAVADAIDAAISKTTVEQASLDEPLRDLVTNITGHVDAALKAVSGATAGLQRRANLLWWKEALFSTSARLSYRDLPPTAAAAQMAFDLHLQVPTFSPASVSAFLFEAVLSLPSIEPEKQFALGDLVADAQSHASLAGLRAAAAEAVSLPDGRGPVLALIAHPDTPASQSKAEFLRLTGVPIDAELTLPGWATWIFRELQGARATLEGVKQPTRRPRKA